MDLWQQILDRLQHRVSRESYENWLEPVEFSHVDPQQTLHLLAPNASTREWLEQEYREGILEQARELDLGLRAVVFVEKPASQAQMNPRKPPAWTQARFDFRGAATAFNPNYTFDNFVVGSCNEFAHAAARAVVTNPARAYNPLYIYGGVGMGKTHLMHAIGRQLGFNFPDLRVVYVSSEEFMNEMINSLRYDRMGSFHERFRSADALLVDDIQTLGSKERTQEEFFHTFNALHNMQRQIVISSDQLPKEVPGLVDRLRSRFEWGLMADIQPPDLETKMAILDRKAEQSKLQLPDDVRTFMATHMRSNIRELEGILTRLVAISSLSGCDITLSMAKRTLQTIAGSQRSKLSIEFIQRTVAEEFSLQPRTLREKSNARTITFPRQVAMYLAKELTPASLPEIGRAFGGKHHTTVLHAVQKIERLRQHDPEINSRINKLTDRIN